MKKTIIIIPVVILLLSAFLLLSYKFEKVYKKEEIDQYKCTSHFPLKFTYKSEQTGEMRIGKVTLYEYNMKARFTVGNLTAIPDDLFKNTPCIQELKLKDKSLSTFPNAIQDLPHLRKLDLQSNRISYISDTAFKHNPELYSLSLEDNLLTNLHLETFKSIDNIQLNKNSIYEIFPTIILNENMINELDLADNQLTTIDLNALYRINQINLNNNQINKILPLNQDPLNASIRTLTLNENKLTRFPKELSDFPDLTRLFLEQNQISGSIPFSGFNALIELDLSGQMITSFTIESASFEDLRTLDLKNNRINIFEIIGKSPNLRNLNLAGNELKKLPISINRLDNLDRLNLANNELSDIPDLRLLTNLNYLNLSYNSLTSIPAVEIPIKYDNFTLNLSQNFITGFDINQVNQATFTLNLSHNDIKNITNLENRYLVSLRNLDLSHNPNLVDFPLSLFDVFENLSTLNLENTGISNANLIMIEKFAQSRDVTIQR